MSIQSDPRIGSELAGYRIDALLGRGGMGVVYRAHDLALDRDVALKLLSPAVAADISFRERFLRESRLAASLEHPNVVPIHDAGEVNGQLYIAMRLVEGTDLKALLKAEGALAPTRVLRIVEQVAGALDAAHARGLVHRDVKPSNVLVAADEHVYLADFGLSRSLGEAGSSLGATQSLGTIDYVAPEQIRGEDVDGRADVYALGCLLQECLTGEPPFRRSTDAAVLFAHLEEMPAGLPGLEQVMTKALAKEPDGRYETCYQLVEATRSALGLEAKPSRWPFAVAAVGIALIGAALLAFFLTQGGATVKAEPGADSLVRIDPQTNKVTKTMPVGRKASGVAAAGDFVWVTNAGDGTVWRIDPKTGTTLKIAVRGTPTGVAIGHLVLVADGPEHRLAAIDPESGSVSYVTALPGSPGLSLQVTGDKAGAGFADSGERIVGSVEEAFKGGTVSEQVRIPPDRTSLVSSYEAFDGLAVGEGAVWVAGDALGRTVWRVDLPAGKVVASIPLSFVPGSIAAGEGAVWVTSLLDDTVSRIDPKTNRITATIHVGRGVDGIAVGEGAVWVTSSIDDTVTRIDPKTNRVVAKVQLDSTPGEIATGAGGVWVTAAKPAAAPPPGAIKIGVLSDCAGPYGQVYDDTLAGAELPLLQRGGKLAGSRLTDGVDGVSIGGRPVLLFFGCADGSPTSALVEARRLVEKVGVDVLIGPVPAGEGLALQEYARRRPGVAFVNGTSGAQQLDPAPNFFSFHLDGAGWAAGLGDYAYRMLGWRTVVTVAEEADPLFDWAQTTGFDAEFCSLGGVVMKRIWVPPTTQDYSSVIAQIPPGVDGLFAATGPDTVLALANGYPPLRGNVSRKMIIGAIGLSPGLTARRISGLVGGGSYFGSGPGHALDRYFAALQRTFPRLRPDFAGTGWDVDYRDAMAATLKALAGTGGDLSDGERRFMARLAKVELDAPNGHVRLDRNHQAVAPTYLLRFRTSNVGRPYRTIPNVETTFGGYFKPSDPPASETTPACRKGNPPPWAR